MVTGYEVEYYENIKAIRKSIERNERSLITIAEAVKNISISLRQIDQRDEKFTNEHTKK